jgi:hypothetical protein
MRLILVLLLFVLGAHSSSWGADTPDFQRDIRPVLSDKCFRCHGPDESTREAGLRLDDRQQALAKGAIVPKILSQGTLLERITSNDPDVMMPPPSSDKKLTPKEVDAIKAWIANGANYEEHWAFVRPKRPEVPKVTSGYRVNNPIDPFVQSQLARHGLSPSAQADRVTLVRRLYLDLIGIPPTPEELDRWVANQSSKWSEQLITELMQSPHFGERWARWWLDAARYSDSDGYEKDKPREVWFYRDWVIKAMNDDMPYDQFIIKQIAGDLLPQATQADRVATGFLRNSMVNEEGGADPEQFRVEGMFDRIDAIGKSILGITTQCAQCHSHKYDPLTQEDFYRMFAALNTFHEAMITVYTPEQQEKRDQVLDEIAKLETMAKQTMPQWRDELSKWHETFSRDRPTWQTLVPTELPWEGQKFRPLDDGSIISESYAPTRNDLWFPCDLEPGTYSAVRLDLLTHPQLPQSGPGRSIYGTGALTQFDFAIPDPNDPNKKQVIKIKQAVADVNPAKVPLPAIYRDKDPTKDDRVTGGIEMAIDGDGKTAWSTDIGPGRRNQDRHAVFVFESPVEIKDKTKVWFHLVQNHGGWNSDDNQNYLMGRYRFSITQHSQSIASDIPSSIESLMNRGLGELTNREIDQLFSHWRLAQASLSDINEKIEALWKQHPEGASQLAVIEREKPRETFVMLRGDFLKPGPKVEPGFPGFLNPTLDSAEPPRWKLAKWMTDRQSPTTARVVVNRLWQAYFGRGIVSTPEDFGRQSPAPTHPELIDWLAMELMDSGWSMKHVHRLIVSSATYQQSSHANAKQLELDRYNEWLGRGPRFRLDAELVRDTCLSISGLLNRDVGGPSVYPPAPGFLFEPPASYGPKVWHYVAGDQQYRRSLYVHSYRSVPYPPLQVFDAPKGDAACIRRERSNTPLQALVMLNEPQFVEMARAFAMRVLRESPKSSDTDRIVFAHRLATSRTPDKKEIQVLLTLLEEQRSRLADSTLNAADLAGTSGPVLRQLTGFTMEEVIPWIVVARALLNLDETITKG